mmetsp:Transcript_112522/g.350735  ORF Transcript_112522/g.350735 Transcript_112522/m.350735 type:complete len:202 (-) Transcript_112522:1333-1938(-)
MAMQSGCYGEAAEKYHKRTTKQNCNWRYGANSSIRWYFKPGHCQDVMQTKPLPVQPTFHAHAKQTSDLAIVFREGYNEDDQEDRDGGEHEHRQAVEGPMRGHGLAAPAHAPRGGGQTQVDGDADGASGDTESPACRGEHIPHRGAGQNVHGAKRSAAKPMALLPVHPLQAARPRGGEVALQEGEDRHPREVDRDEHGPRGL